MNSEMILAAVDNYSVIFDGIQRFDYSTEHRLDGSVASGVNEYSISVLVTVHF